MTTEAQRMARVRASFTAAVLALLGALALFASGVAASPLQESPDTTNLAINVTTPTDGLAAGSVVQFAVTASTPLGLSGVETKLCKTGFTSYNTTTYGYSGASGTRCVKEFTPGGIQGAPLAGGATYRIDPQPFDGSPQTSPTYKFVAGTGAVAWKNAGGFDASLTCDGANPCDMVVKVDHAQGTTYFIQTLTFEGGGTTTTSSASTTSTSSPSTSTSSSTSTTSTSTTSTSTTSTTTSSSSTSTTSTSTTSTTAPTSTTGSPTSTTGTGSTTTVLVGAGSSGGSSASSSPLAFTGASTRDLVSVALLMIALGLFLFGELERRQSRT